MFRHRNSVLLTLDIRHWHENELLSQWLCRFQHRYFDVSTLVSKPVRWSINNDIPISTSACETSRVGTRWTTNNDSFDVNISIGTSTSELQMFHEYWVLSSFDLEFKIRNWERNHNSTSQPWFCLQIFSYEFTHRSDTPLRECLQFKQNKINMNKRYGNHHKN